MFLRRTGYSRQVIDFKITRMPIMFQKYTFRVLERGGGRGGRREAGARARERERKKGKNNVMFILSSVPTSERRKVILKIEGRTCARKMCT
jgi:hypothetical protein